MGIKKGDTQFMHAIQFQQQMIKRFVFKEEAKCNFCQNWFQVFSQIKFGLNICKDCIHKAINTQCFKLPTPEGYLYQVYLARRHVSVQQSQSPLMEKLDDFMHAQIHALLQKWDTIAEILQKNFAETENTEFDGKIQQVFLNDAKAFASLTSDAINGLTKNPHTEQNNNQTLLFTPLKQKNLNTGSRVVQKKSTKRSSSKRSIKSFKQNEPSSMKRTIFLDACGSNTKRQQCSPFSLGVGKMGSARNLNYSEKDFKENKQFALKSQNIKNSIGASLEGKSQIVNEPINIMKERIFEAIENTNCLNKCIQLVAYGLNHIDMSSYLSNLNWEGVEVVKFVKTGLSDEQLREILEFIANKNVETLVLTGNNLTEQACRELLQCDIKSLQNIYMGKNQIIPLKARNEIKQLKNRYNFFV